MPNKQYQIYHPISERDALPIKSKPFREDISRLDMDLQLQYWAFGTLPPVRTLRLAGSKCEVLEWRDTPRP